MKDFKILLIEPNKILAKHQQKYLQIRGFEVSTVSGAGAAIAYADKHEVDLIILELQLVGHGGVEFLQEFRSYKDFMIIPIIIYTTIPPERLAVSELQHSFGAIKLLYKPTTTLVMLERTINEMIYSSKTLQ